MTLRPAGRLVLGVVLGCCAAGLGVRAGGQEAPRDSQATFYAGVDVATIRLTVRNDDDRLVTNLTRDDVRVMVDGRSVPVVAFSNEKRPLTVAIMINTWMDILQIDRLREVGHALVDALEPEDGGVIGSFAQEIAITPFITSDHHVLHRVLNEELWAGNGNPLWNALRLATSSLSAETRRRVVLVMGSHIPPYCFRSSPGRVCDSRNEAMAEVMAKDVRVYGVQLQGGFKTPQARSYPGVPKDPRNGMVLTSGPEVQQLARDTGGGYLRVEDHDPLSETARAVMEELRREYVIGFTPPTQDGKKHSVRVRFARSGLTAQVLSVSTLEGR